ncbi:MAG: EAL domain-containing protein [Yoonia sp.]|uniref:EAL domain-containing protein n=1 Tax=Yoonia sp. TaxID=2212373 RepID=UPI003EF41953
MYLAKTQGLGTPVIFDPQTFAPRLTLLDQNRLKAAIADGEIQPFYQPKVRISDGAHAGFEALARWCHPERGILMPADFLPDVKELGLLPDLTYAILSKCLEDIAEWRRMGRECGHVSVNIPELVLATQSGAEELEKLLSRDRCDGQHITLEITEDVFIARSGQIIQDTINRLSAAGVQISLDDFGTGFASFQHLRQLSFDEMKIDTSFVAGLGADTVADVIVEGFISIANGLGVQIVAEGVETEEQLRHLSRLGCHYAQGFYFGHAGPPEAALDYMPPIGQPEDEHRLQAG